MAFHIQKIKATFWWMQNYFLLHIQNNTIGMLTRKGMFSNIKALIAVLLHISLRHTRLLPEKDSELL